MLKLCLFLYILSTQIRSIFLFAGYCNEGDIVSNGHMEARRQYSDGEVDFGQCLA